MILFLMGMSNSGKTYWSKKLEAVGFERLSCDDFIEKKLKKELKDLNLSGIDGVAKWLGQPFERQYPKTSRKYLRFEKESLIWIIKKLKTLKKQSYHHNIVIDTTGSAIYTGEQILEKLRKLSIIVYLETPASVIKKMCKLYFQNPKPVIWGESFNRLEGETPMEALKRCYPHLLDYRRKKYQKYAHITLDYFLLRRPNFGIEDFLKIIEKRILSLSI